jgi:hypothetical protein
MVLAPELMITFQAALAAQVRLPEKWILSGSGFWLIAEDLPLIYDILLARQSLIQESYC